MLVKFSVCPAVILVHSLRGERAEGKVDGVAGDGVGFAKSHAGVQVDAPVAGADGVVVAGQGDDEAGPPRRVMAWLSDRHL